MSDKDPYIIKSQEELREFYKMPVPLITESKLDFIHEHMAHFIRISPFVCIASGTNDGLDASPRGGEPGFVKILDRKTVAFGDWPGNNKIETMSNILQNGRCGLLFLVPTLDVFFRINGPAVVTRDPELLERLKEHDKAPKTAVKITVNEAYFHCGKTFRRSNLWNPEKWEEVVDFPIIGKILSDLAKAAAEEFTPEQLETLYQKGLKEELY